MVAARLVRAEAWSFLRRDRSRASTCKGRRGAKAVKLAANQRGIKGRLSYTLESWIGSFLPSSMSHLTDTHNCITSPIAVFPELYRLPNRPSVNPAPHTLLMKSFLSSRAFFFSSLGLAWASVLRSKRRSPIWRRSSSRPSVLQIGGGQNGACQCSSKGGERGTP